VEIIDKSKSLCPKCLDVIDADIINESGIVYITKSCTIHGIFKSRHPWSSFRDYLGVKRSIYNSTKPNFADGVVINLNSSCNLHCSFCFARANEYYLEEPDLNRISDILYGFKGEHVYLCGGEPTLRKDLFEVISFIKEKGYKVCLFTNGKLLADFNYTEKLKRSGADLIILQFDTLYDNQYELLRGEKLLSVKLEAIDNLRESNIPIYLFVMLSKDINSNQIKDLLDFALQNNDIVKLVNFNPVWEIGRVGIHNKMDASEILREVEEKTNFSFKDFVSCTEFSYSFFEIVRKLTKRGGRKHPLCEMRCYCVTAKDSLIPISRILDLEGLNKILREINISLDTKQTVFNKLGILLTLPYVFLIKEFLKSSLFRKTIIRLILAFVFRKGLGGLDIISIIVGTFHTAENIDLKMVDTCNLFSDSKEGNMSSCLRQIHFLKNLSLDEVTIN